MNWQLYIHNPPCEHSSKLQLSIRFTPSRWLDVRQDWYPMYYPRMDEGSGKPCAVDRACIEYWHPLGTWTKNLRVHSPE